MIHGSLCNCHTKPRFTGLFCKRAIQNLPTRPSNPGTEPCRQGDYDVQRLVCTLDSQVSFAKEPYKIILQTRPGNLGREPLRVGDWGVQRLVGSLNSEVSLAKAPSTTRALLMRRLSNLRSPPFITHLFFFISIFFFYLAVRWRHLTRTVPMRGYPLSEF